MALALILRNANKLQGYPHLLRSSVVVFNNANSFTDVSNKSPLKSSDLITRLNKNTITALQVRSMSSSDHRGLWKLERLISLGLLGLIPASVIAPNELLDNATSIAIVLHFHWGLEAVAQDYVRPILFGPVIPKVALMIVYFISATTLGGLLYFNYTDIGLGSAIRKLWAI